MPLDCLNVVGNAAIVGGVITHGQAFGADVSGQQAVAMVVDNGTSANDPADQISWSNFDPSFPPGFCQQLIPAQFAGQIWDLTTGQVTVK